MEEQQRNAINQMMEVTACNEDTAREYLGRCTYNVETAVRCFFDGVLPEPIPQEIFQPDVDSVQVPTNLGNSDDTSRAVLPRYHSVFQFLAQLITLPVTIPIYVLSFVFRTFFGTGDGGHGCKSFHEYIDRYLPQFSQNKHYFYGNNLIRLRADHQANGWKYVVVYIHEHQEDTTFLINCLKSNMFRILTDKQTALYGILAGTEEARRLRPDRSFGSKRSCVMIYQINGNTLSRKLTIDNLSDPTAVNRNIQLTLSDLMAEEATREARRNEVLQSRLLMEEQNREYEESLQKDLQKINEKKEKEAEAKRLKAEMEEKKRQSKERAKTVQDFKEKLMNSEKQPEGNGNLLIRFPTGKKIIKFNPEDKLMKLFEEALVADICPLYIQIHLIHPKTPIPCLPKWYYEIMEQEKHEPKPECLDRDLTFEDVGITHGSSVHVDNLAA